MDLVRSQYNIVKSPKGTVSSTKIRSTVLLRIYAYISMFESRHIEENFRLPYIYTLCTVFAPYAFASCHHHSASFPIPGHTRTNRPPYYHYPSVRNPPSVRRIRDASRPSLPITILIWNYVLLHMTHILSKFGVNSCSCSPDLDVRSV